MVMGIPAKVCRELSLECVQEQQAHARRYSDLAQLHAQRLECLHRNGSAERKKRDI